MASLKFLEDLQARVAPYGLTPDGAQWALKALHPASPVGYASIPDDSYCKSARSELRTQSIVSAPGVVSWDLFVWRFPSDTSPVYWASQTASTGSYNGTGGANGQLQIQGLTLVTTPVINMYDNTGTLAVGSDGTRPVQWYVPTAGYCGFRNSYASLTCYLTASATTDQGACFASQGSPEILVPNPIAASNINALATGAIIPVVSDIYTGLPNNEADMAIMNPRYYTAPARDGVYMPIRLTGPVQRFGFATLSTLARGGILTNAALPYYQMINAGSLGSTAVPALRQPSVRPASAIVTPVGPPPITGTTTTSYYTMTDNTNSALVIFRGLDPKATVTLKYITGVEYCVDEVSTMQNFATIPPRYDPRAIETYYRIVQETPDAYPSSWNSFGTLSTMILSGLARMYPYIRPVVHAGARTALALAAPTTMGEQQRVVTPLPVRTLAPKKRAKMKKKTARVPPTRADARLRR